MDAAKHELALKSLADYLSIREQRFAETSRLVDGAARKIATAAARDPVIDAAFEEARLGFRQHPRLVPPPQTKTPRFGRVTRSSPYDIALVTPRDHVPTHLDPSTGLVGDELAAGGNAGHSKLVCCTVGFWHTATETGTMRIRVVVNNWLWVDAGSYFGIGDSQVSLFIGVIFPGLSVQDARQLLGQVRPSPNGLFPGYEALEWGPMHQGASMDIPVQAGESYLVTAGLEQRVQISGASWGNSQSWAIVESIDCSML